MPLMNPIAANNPYYALGGMQKLAPGISGKIVDGGAKGVYVLLFLSEIEGRGHAGRYIDELKEKYPAIRFANVINDRLEQMLVRRGFRKKFEHVPALHGHAEVYVWKK